MDTADKSKDQPKAQETSHLDESSVKHPLQHAWVLWYDKQDKKSSQSNWSDQLKKIYTFSTVEDFWSLWNNIKSASELPQGCNYHIFKEGIQPMWEDEANKRGGKWIVVTRTSQRHKLNNMWLGVVLAVIGCAFEDDDEVCGVVVSLRKSMDKIALWTRSAEKEVCMRIGERFKTALDGISEKIGFQEHESAISNNSSFRNQNKYEINPDDGADGGSSNKRFGSKNHHKE